MTIIDTLGFISYAEFRTSDYQDARSLTHCLAMAVRVLIADDDISIRRLLRRLIESHEGWSVCGDAQDGQEAVAKTSQLNPDVLVLDLAMPDMNGLQAAREISQKTPELPMLLLTVQQVSKELNAEAAHAGFKGVVSKSTGSEVVKAIEVLLQRQNFFQPLPADAPAW
jgi:DNA-binding NarL/FixJ family response regulator